jgi:uncharacterized protein DUF3800
MHILYIDDSGTVGNKDESYFVLGGLSVFERGLYHQIVAADECVAGFALGDPSEIELHGSPMYSGRQKTPWRKIDRSVREKMIKQALATFSNAASVTLFAVAVEKAAAQIDPIELAFEELCNRFNLFLYRKGKENGDDQRGLIVMDESRHEKPLQALARQFRLNGGRWGKYRNLAEVPVFVDSKASRLIQLADLVAYATWRKYEHKDGRFFDDLIPKFDTEGGVIHGLVHYRNTRVECHCPACMSRVRSNRR